MQKLVLAVTDDFSYKQVIKKEGLKRNIHIQYTDSMDEAFELLANKDFLLVGIRADCIDYMPKLKIMREINTIPIILFSYSQIEPSIKVDALRMGADVFLSTPFSLDYIVESCFALIRLYSKLDGKNALKPGSVLVHGHIIISTQTRSVFVKGKEVILPKKHFNLLHMFMIQPGCVLTYKQIFKRIWGFEYTDSEHGNLWNLISRLRKKLKTAADIPDYILTVKEVGYKLAVFFDEE